MRSDGADPRGTVKTYLDYLAKVRFLSPATVKAYGGDLEAFLSWIEREGLSFDGLGYPDIRGYLADLAKRKLSPASVNRALAAARGFYAFAVERKLCAANPFEGVRGLKAPKNLPTVLFEEEIESLLGGEGVTFIDRKSVV